jgi:hypothetical protein
MVPVSHEILQVLNVSWIDVGTVLICHWSFIICHFRNNADFALRKRTNIGSGMTYRAGDRLDDMCRVCKSVREHTVIVADSSGAALRVICDFCKSQHNYRGGDTGEKPQASAFSRGDGVAPLPLVGERERRFPPVKVESPDGLDLELMLRQIIREESGLSAARRPRNGAMVTWSCGPAGPTCRKKAGRSRPSSTRL